MNSERLQESSLVCLVFDLDCTLGNVWSMYQIVMEALQRGELVYKRFVSICADLETEERLGALRPGILRFFQRVAEQQRAGLFAKCVIYSNNSSLEMLEFARDVIHTAVGSEVFCSCVHWEHSLRQHEIVPGDPGNGKKTWTTLQSIYVKDLGILPSLKKTLFYDDQHHPDLEAALGQNYILVKAYEYKVPRHRQLMILGASKSGNPVSNMLGRRNNQTLVALQEDPSYLLDWTLDRFLGVVRGGAGTRKRRLTRGKRRQTRKKKI